VETCDADRVRPAGRGDVVEAMKILVHYGKAKTGTTAIQQTLAMSRRELRQYKVVYPKLAVVPRTQQSLAITFKDREKLHPNFLQYFDGDEEAMRKGGEYAWALVEDHLTRFKPDVLILSGEEFYAGMTHAGQERFRQRLLKYSDDIQPIVYLREPAAHYLSLVYQNAGNVRELPRPYASRDRWRVEILEEVFGRKPALCTYDRSVLEGGDVVRDFMTRFLPDVPLDALNSPQYDNTSLSAESTSIMLWYIKHHITERTLDARNEVLRLRKALKEIENTMQGVPKARLRDEVRQAIQRSATDLLWLREHYDIVFPNVSYDRIDGAPIPQNDNEEFDLDEVVVIDPEWRERILAALTSNALTQMPLPDDMLAGIHAVNDFAQS